MAVAGESIPQSVDALGNAMKGIPAFVLSFALIARFWSAHANWSRAYGLDDATSVRLSLALVMLLLIFVYPVRMVFASLCNALSNGWLPSGFTITELSQIPVLFMTFAIAFGSMGTVMWALHFNAWRMRDTLQLDAREIVWTRARLWNWAIVPLVSMVSIGLALGIPATKESGWLLGLPGFVFFTINLCEIGISLWARARLRALPALA
jgi:uncharacterized membrane protein